MLPSDAASAQDTPYFTLENVAGHAAICHEWDLRNSRLLRLHACCMAWKSATCTKCSGWKDKEDALASRVHDAGTDTCDASFKQQGCFDTGFASSPNT